MRKTPIYDFTCHSEKIEEDVKSDKNECLEENDCADNAVCIDKADGYDCECPEGFKESGKECTDINECEGENSCASVGGKCINEQGKYRCECRVGFKGDGISCEDVDECETHDCGMESECTNTAGSFRCDCHSGFEKNDEDVCVDIDECGINNHTCHAIEHSYCFNLKKRTSKDPGYKCVCESGYRKISKACVRRGSTVKKVKYLGAIVGGSIAGLILITVGCVWLRKRRQKQLKAQQLLEDPMAPDDASLDLSQGSLPEDDHDD